MVSASSLCSMKRALADKGCAGAVEISARPPKSDEVLALVNKGLNKAGGKRSA